MKTSPGTSPSPGPRRHRSILLTLAAIMLAAALLVGVSDNVPGVGLLYAASISAVLAFVHHWRTPRAFGRLTGAGALGFLLFAFLHNIADAGAGAVADTSILGDVLQALGVTFFLIALFPCPAALIVGVGGLIVTAIAGRGRSVPHEG
jgi:hypothetical protein